MYSSRSNLLFREQRGESYGAHATVVERPDHGVFDFEIDVRTPQLRDALGVLLEELERLGDPSRILDEELTAARTMEVAALRARFEHREGLALQVLDAVVEGRSLEELPRRILEVEQVSREDVAAAAREWLAPDQVAISVEGERGGLARQRFDAPGGTGIGRP